MTTTTTTTTMRIVILLVKMVLTPAVFGFSKNCKSGGTDDVRSTIRPGTGGTNRSRRRTSHIRRQRLAVSKPFPGRQLPGAGFLSMVLPSQENSGEGKEGSCIDEASDHHVLSAQETRQQQPQSPTSKPPPDMTKSISIEERFNKLLDSVDEFLDTPFFDPDQYLDDNKINARDNNNNNNKMASDGDEEDASSDDNNNNDDGLVTKFARLVKEDYELAETLFVGTFFVVLIIGTQELLRMQLYGDSYVPFLPHPSSAGGNGGKLF